MTSEREKKFSKVLFQHLTLGFGHWTFLMFCMIDGIAGSGKTTLLRAAMDEARAMDCRIFDLMEWTKTQAAAPRFADVMDYDVYFTFEPTKQWIGSAIRGEMSQTQDPYSGESLAHAFSLDREIMYRRFILPALAAGKTVIQDRGVTTSLVYQPIMPGGLPLENMMELPGNKLALSRVPDVLLLTDLDIETAIARIAARDDAGKGVFADPVLLTKVSDRFRSPWFTELFSSRGSQVHTFDTRTPQPETITRMRAFIQRLIRKQVVCPSV